ncbi:rhomboid family protein [Thermoclostridium stercorarium subsp. stercorarium DSM 8532]|uniref:Rhomboid family protein n=2 Tax=Thermoclostridium stercorarium TaxID=1510 RepID=L7VLW6_THES1|nr:rhomboid family intramembrane serine protease [Thermoclostridium stercorarium]AGC67717.1 rhomboid family protein [Thermoclostridium stercorarium subsp. stercorarium DSM 8532]AGI38768.1 membrane protein [Thermoclostridium stercorarium subsp. stercorarium DSM 8532]ANW98132.1 rhomboid family intramembrane serine protease [Thermoclostridium stercorarium subsp. thermolacticum DSM 2910]
MLKRIHYNSPVILTYAFLSLTALVIGYITDMDSTRLLFSVYRSNPADIFFYLRLFGHVLGHVNWEHYVNNFLIILLVGPMLEMKYGSKNMLRMILITAFTTGILNIIFFDTALLGASGVAFMLIILSSFVNIKKGSIPLTLILTASLYLGREIMAGLTANDDISQFAHIAGGICGGVFGFTLRSDKN